MTFNIIPMQKTLQLAKEILTILIVSSILGIISQSVLPNGIDLITQITLIETDSGSVALPTVSINPQSGDENASHILLTDAYAAFTTGEAIFFDARGQNDYQQGHIRGAINLPVYAFMDSLEFLDKLKLDQFIITYCDGAECNASIDLAADLTMMGFSRVSFFFGGWQEWQTAGYPTDTD